MGDEPILISKTHYLHIVLKKSREWIIINGKDKIIDLK
jgi:hypothetical protein